MSLEVGTRVKVDGRDLGKVTRELPNGALLVKLDAGDTVIRAPADVVDVAAELALEAERSAARAKAAVDVEKAAEAERARLEEAAKVEAHRISKLKGAQKARAEREAAEAKAAEDAAAKSAPPAP